MIRYRWHGLINLFDAAEYKLPGSQQLKGRGPWNWSHEKGNTVAALIGHDYAHSEMSEWRQGLGDYEVQHIKEIPPWDADYWGIPGLGVLVNLTPGAVSVQPLSYEGRGINWDGTAGEPITDYGRRCVAMLSRIANEETIPVNDRQLVELCRESIMMATTLTAEMVHLFGFINEVDNNTIIEAIADCPKA